MELLINTLYIYVAIFSVYFLILAVRNLSTHGSIIKDTVAYNIERKQLCVIIYTHNQLKDLERLISQLRNQDYSINNYQVYVILDNCTDGSADFLNLKPSVNVLSLSEGGLIGKDSAYSILIEKLIPNTNIDSYVFLDVDKYIDEKFLTKVNYELTKHDVITGAVVYQNHKQRLSNKIKRAYIKYINNFLLCSRSLLGLSNTINSELLIIKKSLVDAIGSIDFKNPESELKYSLLLSKIKKRCYFNPNIRCYSVSKNIDRKIPRLSSRLKLFKNCFFTTKTTNFSYVEYVYSLLNPNNLFIIISYTFIILFSLKYYFFVSTEIVLSTCLCLILGFFLSLIHADLRGKEYLYLCLYPFYSLIKIILGLPGLRLIVNFVKNKSNRHVQKYVVNVQASFRNKNLPCKIELIVKNDMSKVVFKYKNKKFTTSSYLRMNDAINELISKLRDYSITLKICQSCKYFKSISDGSQNMIQGKCTCQLGDVGLDQTHTVLSWNCCSAFDVNLNHSVIEDIANN